MDSSLHSSQCLWEFLAYLHSDLFGFGLFCLMERHSQQAIFIISLDFIVVYFNGQLNMPYELARGPFTAMERFRLHLPRHAPFLPCDAKVLPTTLRFMVSGSTPGARASTY